MALASGFLSLRPSPSSRSCERPLGIRGHVANALCSQLRGELDCCIDDYDTRNAYMHQAERVMHHLLALQPLLRHCLRANSTKIHLDLIVAHALAR